MSDPFIGEIRMFGGNFAPAGWALCNGQILAISENETLFQLIGTMYGGDGQETFALPDLSGRIPIHQGQGPALSNHGMGESGGVEEVTLTVQQLPAHALAVATTAPAGSGTPAGNVVGDTTAQGVRIYGPNPDSALSPSASQTSGGSQPHSNLMPYLCVNFIISLYGIFPPQS
jgi:microcystin-dependent protein